VVSKVKVGHDSHCSRLGLATQFYELAPIVNSILSVKSVVPRVYLH
jgi:hypothetical protein